MKKSTYTEEQVTTPCVGRSPARQSPMRVDRRASPRRPSTSGRRSTAAWVAVLNVNPIGTQHRFARRVVVIERSAGRGVSGSSPCWRYGGAIAIRGAAQRSLRQLRTSSSAAYAATRCWSAIGRPSSEERTRKLLSSLPLLAGLAHWTMSAAGSSVKPRKQAFSMIQWRLVHDRGFSGWLGTLSTNSCTRVRALSRRLLARPRPAFPLGPRAASHPASRPGPGGALGIPRTWEIAGLPAIIRRAGPEAERRTVEFFENGHRQPQYPPGLCAGGDAVHELVR